MHVIFSLSLSLYLAVSFNTPPPTPHCSGVYREYKEIYLFFGML